MILEAVLDVEGLDRRETPVAGHRDPRQQPVRGGVERKAVKAGYKREHYPLHELSRGLLIDHRVQVDLRRASVDLQKFPEHDEYTRIDGREQTDVAPEALGAVQDREPERAHAREVKVGVVAARLGRDAEGRGLYRERNDVLVELDGEVVREAQL